MMSMLDKDEWCVWTYSNDDDDCWVPDCPADPYQFNKGGPRDNHFKFCPFCGKKLKEKKA